MSAPTKDELAAQLKVQSKLVKDSQADPTRDPADVQALVDHLAQLRLQLASMQNTKAKKEVKIMLKNAKVGQAVRGRGRPQADQTRRARGTTTPPK